PQFFLDDICSTTMLCFSFLYHIPCICCLHVAIRRTICTSSRYAIRVPSPPSAQFCPDCAVPQAVRVSFCTRQICSLFPRCTMPLCSFLVCCSSSYFPFQSLLPKFCVLCPHLYFHYTILDIFLSIS